MARKRKRERRSGYYRRDEFRERRKAFSLSLSLSLSFSILCGEVFERIRNKEEKDRRREKRERPKNRSENYPTSPVRLNPRFPFFLLLFLYFCLFFFKSTDPNRFNEILPSIRAIQRRRRRGKTHGRTRHRNSKTV